MTVTIGLVGAGSMGSGLGASWLAGGNDVRTCVVARSERTRSLARDAGIELVPSLDDVVTADIVVSIVPPGAAIETARQIAAAVGRARSSPLVADFNAVSPATVARIAAELKGIDFVDGAVSGMPPRPEGRTTLYLSGPRANEVANIESRWYEVAVLGSEIGRASALKMTTSSMYKGTNALVMQAILTASHFGVLDEFLADVSPQWSDNIANWPWEIAMAATKSGRFVDEMREIAITQTQAGLAGALFEGVAQAFERATHSELATTTPESIDRNLSLDEIIARLR